MALVKCAMATWRSRIDTMTSTMNNCSTIPPLLEFTIVLSEIDRTDGAATILSISIHCIYKPVGNRIQIEDGEVTVRPSVVETDCSAERWLQTDLDLKRFG